MPPLSQRDNLQKGWAEIATDIALERYLAKVVRQFAIDVSFEGYLDVALERCLAKKRK